MKHQLSPIAVALLASISTADTIHLTSGAPIEEASIVTETYKEIQYKLEGKSGTKTVAADRVLRVDYRRKPPLVDRADLAVAEEHYADALDDFDLYLSGFLEGNKRERLAWAPAYAARRIVEINFTVGNFGAVAAAAERLIENFPDSRHVPAAYLWKAEAQLLQEDGDGAQKTIEAFSKLLDDEALSERWRLECDLALVLSDISLKGGERRDKLGIIATSAGAEYPTVRNRAAVAKGESFIEGKKFDEAQTIFKKIVDDPKADARTLAGAYTGLGDCQYQQAAALLQQNKDAQLVLKSALLSYMRVVVVYKNQTLYVPKAMFYAGRIFELTGSEESRERAQAMYRAVLRQYRGSAWAQEAKNFVK